MSWDQILAGLTGKQQTGSPTEAPQPAGASGFSPKEPSMGGAESGGFGSALKETMLGGTTKNPTGMLEQMGRILGTVGAFSHSPQAGMSLLNFFKQQDEMSASALSKSAAEGLSPEEARMRYPGMIPSDPDVNLVPQDLAPGGPSAPERKAQIAFPSSPQDMEEARRAHFAADSAAPGYGNDFTPEQMTQSAAQAQRLHMPTDFRQNNAALAASQPEGGFDTGVYEAAHTVTPEGMKSVFRTMDPLSQSYPYETIQNTVVPEGVKKVVVDDQGNPGRAFVKFVNTGTDTSMSGPEIAMSYAKQLYPNDLEKQRDEFFRLTHGGSGGSARPGTTAGAIAQAQKEVGRDLSLGEQARVKSIWEKKSSPYEAILAQKPGYKSVSKEEELTDYLNSLKSQAQAQGTAIEGKTGSTQILEQQRQELYDSHFGSKTNPEPTPTPYAPKSGAGMFGTNNPPPSPDAKVTPTVPMPEPGKRPKGKLKIEKASKPGASMVLFESLSQNGPEQAGKDLAVMLNSLEGSPEQKKILMREIVDSLEVGDDSKLAIEKSAVEDLE